MYLKRLEIYGFKTFADRTDLEFGPGITAIVGPNGSGKSNISDAILWVLGEQGMKVLRSSKSLDVIFNGSDARKASGLAEVHLTLDNSSGLLPTDFREVTIARRLFRSGDSEYLINRVPVRLRDVQDLFLDTGIGKQSYSIISQGEVDAVLSSRSEERRALFEEVAGINKYKHRKKDALRKLEQTRLNLLRVVDIINELDNQIEPLAAQSEAASAFQSLQSELDTLKLALLVTQYHGLCGSRQRAREREEELQTELATLRHNFQQIEIREATLRAELAMLDEELDERRNLEGKLANAVQGAEGKLTLFQEQQHASDMEALRLQKEREEWIAQSGQFEQEIARAQQAQAALAEQISAMDDELTVANGAIQSAAEVVDNLAKEIQHRRSTYFDKLSQVSQLRNELARVESTLTTAQARDARIDADVAELTSKISVTTNSLTEISKLADERRLQREKLLEQRNAVNKSRQAMQEKQSALRVEESKAREELAGVRARQKTLQELEESHEGYYPGVRAVMNAHSAGRLKGWYAPVSELLTVPERLEVAIEAALGANLQDLATISEDTAREAIAFLKSERAGRATFLPLDIILPDRRSDCPLQPGIMGLAMQLVDFRPEHEMVVQHLLGRVIIAEDLTSALQLAKSNLARGWKTIVTLEGEVVTPARTISGGSQGKGSGLLKRKRELQKLTGQLEELTRVVNDLMLKGQQTAADIQSLDAEIQHLARDAEKLAGALAEAERGITATQRELRSLEERLAAFALEKKQIAADLAAARLAEQASTLAVEQAQAILLELEADITNAEQELTVGQREREEVQQRSASLRVRYTELRGEMQRHQTTASRAEELRDSLANRLAENYRSLDALAKKITTLNEEKAQLVSELQQISEAYQRSTVDLAGVKSRRTTSLDTIAANLEEQKQGRVLIEDCQSRSHRAELRTTQVETELGFLEAQLFEDYRLNPEQALARCAPVENRGLAVARMKTLQMEIAELGTVNLGAIEEFQRVRERLAFLTAQRSDLETGRDRLNSVIKDIDLTCIEKFNQAFARISVEFQDIFSRLFGGGKTALSLENPNDVLESGIEINVTIPGKRNQNLLQLSGGERALTALALLFAMLRVKPSPFVVLDEIDAPLDEANVGRYCDVLRDFCNDTQFLTVTHNKGTMEIADVLYGVTMEKAGVSSIVSVRLSDNTSGAVISRNRSEQNGPYQNEKRSG